MQIPENSTIIRQTIVLEYYVQNVNSKFQSLKKDQQSPTLKLTGDVPTKLTKALVSFEKVVSEFVFATKNADATINSVSFVQAKKIHLRSTCLVGLIYVINIVFYSMFCCCVCITFGYKRAYCSHVPCIFATFAESLYLHTAA